MVYEVVIQSVIPERRDEYIESYKKRWREMSLAGWHNGRLLKSIEKPGRVIIVLEWDSVEAHRQHRGPVMDGFRQDFVWPYLTAVSESDHFTVQEIATNSEGSPANVVAVHIQNTDPEHRDEYIQRYSDEWRDAPLPGCKRARILRAIDNPGRVILILEWDSIEAHRTANATPAHDKLMENAVRKYQTVPSDSAHYQAEEI